MQEVATAHWWGREAVGEETVPVLQRDDSHVIVLVWARRVVIYRSFVSVRK